MKDESICKRATLCQFEISRDLADAIVEVCRFCMKKVIYYKEPKTGRIDNRKYLADHRRDFVQPYGKDYKLYVKLYGTEGIETAQHFLRKRMDKEKQRDAREELIERRKFLRRRALGHSLIRDNWQPPSYIKKTGIQ